MNVSRLFEKFRDSNPWPVQLDEQANAVFEEMVKSEEGMEEDQKSQKLLIDIIHRATLALRIFPPDERIFTDPRPSLDNLHIWLVVSLGHKKILVKAQYRLDEHICWVTDIGVKGA